MPPCGVSFFKKTVSLTVFDSGFSVRLRANAETGTWECLTHVGYHRVIPPLVRRFKTEESRRKIKTQEGERIGFQERRGCLKSKAWRIDHLSGKRQKGSCSEVRRRIKGLGLSLRRDGARHSKNVSSDFSSSQRHRLPTNSLETSRQPFGSALPLANGDLRVRMCPLSRHVLRQLASNEGQAFPKAVQILDKVIYVDDTLFGADDIETLNETREQLIALMDRGEFQLRKWTTNAMKLLQDIPPDHQELSNHSLSYDDSFKVLGLSWFPLEDSFRFIVAPYKNPTPSKRSILFFVAKLFDPLGWASPIVISAKILLQELWLAKVEWDAALPEEIRHRWSKYCAELPSTITVIITLKIKLLQVDELAFHNSTQLQLLDLSGNILETLNERTMEGLLRLESLDLRNNRLASLPETIFDSSRIYAVEKIDLSGNRFNEIPIRALQRQVTSLFSLKLARNRVVEVFTQDIINNVKELDLSENPLSENAIRSILGEAKILRSLNLANTSIKTIPRLEIPFLKHLNLSGNELADIKPVMLERTTMLESLDVSKNRLKDFTNLTNTFKNLPVLQSLDISDNKIKTINESNFDGLATLHSLKMANLLNCTRIEKNAFKSLTKLRFLHAYNYPKLGYFDVQGILKSMANLEILDIEIKDSSIGNEQLSARIHPYLRELTLRGERLRNILSSSLVGVRGPKLFLSLKDTSVDSIPTALFFPIPRSTKVELNVAGSKFANLPPQLLAALDERGGSVKISGLDNNPINCSCEARHLWKWLKLSGNKVSTIVCANPDNLMGISLSNLTEEYLCDHTTSTKSQMTETTLMKSTTLEPEIIWTVAPTIQNNRNNYYNNDHTGKSY
ncbi:PREDICTED: uncharacterized protein LOC105450604 [Wasmannia auropunctata]|uniref:uncharacterized protein LOC105450604 n=1 Tax=Wasmannia auropunctata TaxID=64793 RepID=UPI0005EFA029|nr:PREDICTED: uncharacterized protein LOC105450604 [Wasmannia auropunctata]